MIAVAIATVGYALVLAIGQPTLPRVAHDLSLELPERPPRPQRLPALPRIHDHAFATRRTEPEGERHLTVVLTGVTAVIDPELAGVATFDSITGGDFRWFPLAQGEAQEDGSLRLAVTTAVRGRVTIAFAAAREHARHGYLARHELVAPLPGGAAAEHEAILLDGTTHRVRLELPANVDRAGPLRLQRTDDRQWLPMLHSTSGLVLRRGVELVLDLGAGTYELQDPIAPDRSQRFTVPGTDRVVLNEALAPVRADRQ